MVAEARRHRCVAAVLVDAPILRLREAHVGVSERRDSDRPDRGDGAQPARALVRRRPARRSIAVVSKYVFRTRSANVFNPAALGARRRRSIVFDTGQSWWGALPELPPVALVVLFATGIFIADRVNKMPLVLAFLGVYYLLFTVDGVRRRSRRASPRSSARPICRRRCSSRSSS